jgi:hypothetical protein
MRLLQGLAILTLLLCHPLRICAAQLHHDLAVSLDPEQASLEVTDTITVPRGTDTLVFSLHPGLQPRLLEGDAQLARLPAATGGDRERGPERYRVTLPAGRDSFTLRYSGRIRHALQQQGEEYARSFSTTRGMISPEGVFLSGSGYWYPHIEASLLSFDLALRLPGTWKGMSQGDRLETLDAGGNRTERWRCTAPQEEIYLIAGPFTEYAHTQNGVQAMALLRRPDPALAQKYLDATHRYIALYDELIGPYPFGKFALVENFWETGYGMPSFTLLGPKVIRLPFILNSSYPHEILHNWWGNSVYIDYESGNWAEGLTSYLADHLIKEQQGRGAGYRRNTLQKYADYAGKQKDFPLTAFRGRHSARTEAIGYGKTLMLFHMLRRHLGDAVFIEGLRSLYRQHRFRVVDFSTLQRVFSDVAQRPLDNFFAQWVERTGAPQLHASRVQAEATDTGYRLTMAVEQTQPGETYDLELPLAITLEGRQQASEIDVRIRQSRETLQLDLPARPLHVELDPGFDVFRRLHRNEIPPAISQAIGAERVLIVLPSKADTRLRDAYRKLAESWQRTSGEQLEVITDDALEAIPADRTVWLFGWKNRFRPGLSQALQAYDFQDQGERVQIGETTLAADTHSIVVMARQPRAADMALGWLAADSAAALPGLARKLPHYGRYSYLAFTGTAPNNTLKGQWPVVDSPMSVRVAQADGAVIDYQPAGLAPRSALVAPVERFSATRMAADIATLAGTDMAGRGLDTAELERAAGFIADRFAATGLQPGGDDSGWFQVWQQPVGQLGRDITLKNVIGILPGSDPARAGESLVIGAHYDHFGRGEYADHETGRGRLHPGADDNASGVAVMLELARSLEGKPRPRTLVFVAFTAEETGRLGSRHYVQHAGDYPVDRVIAMLNLDTVGRLEDRALVLFGTGTAEEWVHIFRGAGYVTGVPIRTVADDFGSSDQTSFIEAGVPAVQFFGGAHEDIHRPGDTPDRIDHDGLVSVAKVLYEATEYLSARPDPLGSALSGSKQAAPAGTHTTRRVSLGTVPDFTWSGDGVRLDDVRPDTPAERAGLKKGDIILRVNGTPVGNMRQYAGALKQLSPGDEIRVDFSRDGTEQHIITHVTER